MSRFDDHFTIPLDSFLSHPDDDFHVARISITSAYDLKTHDHDYAEVFWIKSGKGIHWINGEKQILEKGDLMMIRPEDKHTYSHISDVDRLVFTNIAFRTEQLNYYRKRYFKGINEYFWTDDVLPYKTRISNSFLSQLSSMTDSLLIEEKDLMHLDQIMLFIFQNLKESAIEYKDVPHWLCLAMTSFNTPEAFAKGVPGFVDITGRSTDHVNRILKKYLNQTLTDTVNKARLKYGAQLLSLTNTPIKKISSECGFETVSYFHKIFKKFYGTTPTKYRKLNNKVV